MAVHEGFRTTSGGLRDCFPPRLYHKAKRLGAWDPVAFDFTWDRRDWEGRDELQRRGKTLAEIDRIAEEDATP